jgi:hypothetical protein
VNIHDGRQRRKIKNEQNEQIVDEYMLAAALTLNPFGLPISVVAEGEAGSGVSAWLWFDHGRAERS